MKNFKKIIALLTSAMMLSSVSVFAEVPEDGTDTSGADIAASTAVSYLLSSTVDDAVAPGETFDVTVKVGAKDSTDYVGIGTLTFDIEYDTSLFDVAVSASQPTKKSNSSFEGEDEEDYYWTANASSANVSSGVIHTAKVSPKAGKALAGYFNNSNYHYVSTENAFLTFTFTVKADAVATKDVTLKLEGCEATNYASTVQNTNASVGAAVVFDVEVAGGNDEVTADKAEGTAYDTYTFENLEEGSVLAGKKVLMQKEKAPVSGITADTRFIVSDGTRTQIFGGDIWDKLNVEGEGAVKAVNVIFGLIVDAANTSTFTFDVQ